MQLFNFSAGPATLPKAVIKTAKAELTNWQNCGVSVMEMSHRGQEFSSIAAEAETDLRQLMTIPGHYQVLFLSGGATSQFSMVPINLLRGKTTADYINTGIWSQKAINEAKKYCSVNVVYTANDSKHAPCQEQLKLSPDAAFVHYVPNETIGGVAFDYVPETGSVPLVADMSSCILAQTINVSKFGLIYAGAQKNIGPAGLTIVIVREDLIGMVVANQPTMFDYQIHAKSNSTYNTPPTYAWYLSGLVFKWLLEYGGISAIARTNHAKAEKLYTAIDKFDFYSNLVAKNSRSLMNVPFALADHSKDKQFLQFARDKGLINLIGHRSVGGMRASIYNAMPEEGVDLLITTMQEFADNI